MRRIFVLLCLTVLLLTGCSKDAYISRDIYAMDTIISVNIAYSEDCETALDAAEELIYDLDSKFVAPVDSDNFEDTELVYLIDYAFEIKEVTDGAYDPNLYTLSRLWNVNGGGYLPTEDEIAAALLDNKMDLGGIAKGYALEQTVKLLKADAEYGMVSFGGNIGVWGKKPDASDWKVGIRDPFDTSEVIGYLTLSEEGYVAVSGDYERYFEVDGVRYHHILDPETGYPVSTSLHSVAVFTRDGALGDALSTALFVMGYEKGTELYNAEIYDFEALFITDEGLFMTEGMEEMFTNED